MEAAGLALGAIALIGLFKECVDLFEYFSASRSAERDRRILETKLDIEKTLFLQWAEKVHLLKLTDFEDRLHSRPALKDTIQKTLESIHTLLSDSENLRKRYGLKQAKSRQALKTLPTLATDQKEGQGQKGESTTTISHHRMLRFQAEFAALRLDQSDANSQGKISKSKKALWVIVDRDKFSKLLEELSYFITRLYDLFPPEPKLELSMVQEDIQSLNTVPQLRMVFEASVGDKERLAEEAKQSICRKKILQMVWFRTMDNRRDDVKPAHSRTLEWALQSNANKNEPGDNPAWDNLPEWLRSGSGHYWISGKAGSGKSTLMKFIWSDPKTIKCLREWTESFKDANDANLIIESFFFWHLGTSEQKFHEGLWRAILYKILDSDPFLIPELLPKVWRQLYNADVRTAVPELPSPSEVDFAFGQLVKIDKPTTRFCFFIDGLDEYSGVYDDAISFIKRLGSCSHVKIVVSSRPIPQCTSAFEDTPKLFLQDLNKTDIENYVTDTVASHPYAKVILKMDEKRASRILEDLVQKSEGVFLWVVLACSSVLDGFTNFDRFADLEERVRELPEKLENLFQHMLDQIEPRYQEQAAKLLWVCHRRFQLSGSQTMHSMALALIDQLESDVIEPVWGMKLDEKQQTCFLLEGRLRSRCCGLLEVIKSPVWHSFGNICVCGGEKEKEGHDDLVDSMVTVIHRSVFEFLEMPGVQDLPCLSIQKGGSDVPLYLAYAALQLLVFSCESDTCEENKNLFVEALESLDACTSTESKLAANVMKALQTVVGDISTLYRGLESADFSELMLWERCVVYSTDSATAQSPSVLPIAVEKGYFQIINILMQMGKGGVLQPSYLLRHALRPYSRMSGTLPPSPRMICFLLENSCDATKLIEDVDGQDCFPWTIWTKAARELFESQVLGGPEVHQVSKCFIEAGAQVDLISFYGDRLQTFDDWIRIGLSWPGSDPIAEDSKHRLLRFIESQSHSTRLATKGQSSRDAPVCRTLRSGKRSAAHMEGEGSRGAYTHARKQRRPKEGK